MERTGRERLARERGYTLVEVLVVVVVIAIMAALIVPLMNYTGRARVAVAKDSLLSLAKAMKRFHEDTGLWPLGNGTWNGATGTQQGPVAFTTSDVSLHAPPSGMNICVGTNGPLATPCWGGPYLNFGSSMGDPQLVDPWGLPFEYAYVPPGTLAPNGIILLWSAGPNLTNDTTDLTQVARGQSQPGSDDIVQVVGSAL